jgi:prophage antirepressor-like protein
MKTVQLFTFQGHDVRSLTDENGNPWFAAKDVFAGLDIKWSGKKVSLAPIKEQWQLVLKLKTPGGMQATTFINEAAMYKLAFRSNKPEAELFTDWVASEVLPALRKTGTFSLKSQLLPAPRMWEKTFPAEFMRNVLKLYGLKYDPKKGTPSFLGHFINEYVYNTLDRGLGKALKLARSTYGGDDEVAFLHQFLAEPAREALQNHIMVLNGLAAGSATIEGFKMLYERAFTHRNQLEMYLR